MKKVYGISAAAEHLDTTRMTINRKIKEGIFPRPETIINVGTKSTMIWNEKQLDEWSKKETNINYKIVAAAKSANKKLKINKN